MLYLEELQLLGKIILSMALGAVIGYDRELANRPAGLRTHMLVAGSATLLVGLIHAMLLYFKRISEVDVSQSDPIRVIEAIITGISFLGAGTIFRKREKNVVEGLTTAASILFCSAIGISVAIGELVMAVGATALTLFVLRGLNFFEGKSQKVPQDSDDSP